MTYFDKLKMEGPLWVEQFEVPEPGNQQKSPFLNHTQPLNNQTWNENNKGRVIYDKQTGTLWYGDGSANNLRTLNDIPSGNIFLFESSTQQLGYTLLTDVTDGIVYYTNNSGGDIGGQAKVGGTWTSPSHTHTAPSHSHTISNSHTHSLSNHTHNAESHRHQTWNTTLSASQLPPHTHSGAFWGNYAASHGRGGSEYFGITYFTGYSGESQSHNHGPTGFTTPTVSSPSINVSSPSGTGITGMTAQTIQNAAITNTWRPYGRNYTRQRRN